MRIGLTLGVSALQVLFSLITLRKWNSDCVYQLHSSGQGSVHSSQRGETTVDELSQASCVWAHLSDRSPHYGCTALSNHSDFAGWRLHVCSAVTCHPDFFLLRMTGVFYALKRTRGWNETRVRTESWRWRRRYYCPSSRRSDPRSFRSRVRRSTVELYLHCNQHSTINLSACLLPNLI